MELSIELVLLIFLVSMGAGFIDSISGGGGLISLPALMLFGLTPAQALATNKLQSIFGKASSVKYFLDQGILDASKFRVPTVLAFLCSGLGAALVQYLSSDWLMTFMPWMIGAAACYIIISPRMSDIDHVQRMSIGLFGITMVPVISFYDGFFGPASGSFFAISFIALLGYSSVKATAYTKQMLLASNAGALLAFIGGGQVIWQFGFVMALGQWIGARYGSQLVHIKGSKLIKPMLLTICLILVVKMTISQA